MGKNTGYVFLQNSYLVLLNSEDFFAFFRIHLGTETLKRLGGRAQAAEPTLDLLHARQIGHAVPNQRFHHH